VTETNRAMWDRYSEAWKETTRDKKLAALRASVAPTCRQVIGNGTSYAEYDDRGMLVTMTGFFAR